MGRYFVQMDKLIGTQPEGSENGTGKDKVRTVQVASNSMVKEQQMADSSLCQFGNKALVSEVKPGTLQ